MYQVPEVRICLDVLSNRLSVLASQLKPDVGIIAVIKSDAYGHGMVPIASVCNKHPSVHYLAVVRLNCAIELIESGITTPILLLIEPDIHEIPLLVQHSIIPVISSFRFLDAFTNFAHSHGNCLSYHLKIDTGMTRFGIRWNDPALNLGTLLNSNTLRLAGICTHLSSSETPESKSVYTQLSRFESLITPFKSNIPSIHVLASGGFAHYPAYQYTHVRLGDALYHDVMTLDATIIEIKQAHPGDTVGYDDRFMASGHSHWIAIVGCGYSNGVPTQLWGKSKVEINGFGYPIVGSICMDVLFVDLGSNPHDVQLGDRVRIMGPSSVPETTSLNIANHAKINHRELLCHIGRMNDRQFIGLTQHNSTEA